MNELGWLPCALWGSVILFLLCALVVVWCIGRDRSLRGMRVTNGEVQRENVTITLPSFALRDFKDRTYK